MMSSLTADQESIRRKLYHCYIELINCIQFQRCRRNPATKYVSPQRRIEELEAEVARLRNRLPSE